MAPAVIEQPNPIEFYSHRSGNETAQYCPRKRYLAYHHLNTGVNIFPPIYFEIGTCVHAGLALILQWAIDFPSATAEDMAKMGDAPGQDAVDLALGLFAASPITPTLRLDELAEQTALISGLLWAFWFRVWPQFYSRYKVLMVEAPSDDAVEFELTPALPPQPPVTGILHVLSRPDAIVQDRQTGEVIAINWKTINSITDERRQNIANSLQANLESYYAEEMYKRYLDTEYVPPAPPPELKGKALMQYYAEQVEWHKGLPRELAYMQIVYLVKGARQLLTADGQEIDLDAAEGLMEQEKFWRQDSFLCYRWVDLEQSEKLPGVSWSYRYYKSGNKSYNNLTKKYARQGIWEVQGMNSREWVQQLNSGSVFPSTQNVDDGRNAANPLDKLIFFESPIYRDRDMQIRLLNSFIHTEIEIARKLERVALSQAGAAGPFEQLDDVLDREFPMQLISCRKPTRCEFEGRLCPAGTAPDVRQPLFTVLPDNSIWQKRVPHHQAELEAFNVQTA